MTRHCLLWPIGTWGYKLGTAEHQVHKLLRQPAWMNGTPSPQEHQLVAGLSSPWVDPVRNNDL